MPPAPRDFSGFPNLVSLNPSDVTLWFDGDGAQLERLVAAAPRLALLELANVFTMQIFSDRGAVDPWFIRAPNLRALLIIIPGALDNDCRVAETLPLLEEAYISINGLLGTQCFLDTFRRIATVNNLFFVSLDQANKNLLEGITWKFENLREAHLNANFGKRSSVLSIVSLLRFAPHIKDLHIVADDTEREEDEIDEGFLCSQLSRGLFTSLIHVVLSQINYFSNQMCFTKFVLMKAGSLQSILVNCYYHERKIWYEKASKELVECKMASPQARLRVMLSDKPIPKTDDS